MKIAIVGASGFIGSKITAEALWRGHEVTGIVRNPDRLPQNPKLKAVGLNLVQQGELARALAGHDAVVSAWNAAKDGSGPELYDRFVEGNRAIIGAVKNSGVKRLLVVGGASSLKTPEGVEFIDSAGFPASFEAAKPAMRGVREYYYLLKNEPELDWAYFSPAIMIQPGQKTGHFRLGGDHIVADASGSSRISVEDYAVAAVDELEHPRHHRERFTIGY
ncbi:MAG: NAD(P)-dependent oxidoreductase [Candidatus Acidiferrales bacterium]